MVPDVRERLLRLRFLPTRPELSDPEVAARLDAGQPHLQAAQESAARGDAAALRRALADHLDACVLSVGDERDVRFPADWYDARPGDVQGAEAILRGRVAYVGKLLDVGPRIDWHAWDYPCAESRFVRWFWMHPLVSAYRTTGRGRYARGAMDIVRGFYADARPPAQRPATWYGYNGPWQALMAAGRVPIALDLYRTIGRSDALDDSDRVTFLKLLLEHAEFLYTASDRHIAHNWEVAMMVALLELAQALPGFRDATRWKERAVERFTQNMRDCVLDDGGYWERGEYHFSAILEYAIARRALQQAGEPIPPEWPKALQRMYEWAMWVLTPQRQYPPVGHASFTGGRSYVSRFDEERWGRLPEDSMVPVMGEAADLFPERIDFRWFATGQGRPPERTSRVLPHTGWLVMRSGWSADDLYLIMSYNGSPDVIDTHPDLLSVSVWAHGRAYLSNSGSTYGYEAPEFRSWDMHTRSSNTVMVDGQSQGYLSNGGRLETWESVPSFDYAAAVSRAYEQRGVDHRRAVLLVKPRYWVIHDVLEGDGRTHEYRWHGHFQPTELAVDADAGMIATDERAGARLFTAYLPEDGQTLEQDTGPISTPAGTQEAPYVALVQRSARPVAFTVVLYPATAGSGPPGRARAAGHLNGRAGCDPRGCGLPRDRRHARGLRAPGAVLGIPRVRVGAHRRGGRVCLRAARAGDGGRPDGRHAADVPGTQDPRRGQRHRRRRRALRGRPRRGLLPRLGPHLAGAGLGHQRDRERHPGVDRGDRRPPVPGGTCGGHACDARDHAVGGPSGAVPGTGRALRAGAPAGRQGVSVGRPLGDPAAFGPSSLEDLGTGRLLGGVPQARPSGMAPNGQPGGPHRPPGGAERPRPRRGLPGARHLPRRRRHTGIGTHELSLYWTNYGWRMNHGEFGALSGQAAG